MQADKYTGVSAVELIPGTLRGYRAWNYVEGALEPVTLYSGRATLAWATQGRLSTATCHCHCSRHDRHKAPGPDCHCGFYARYSPLRVNIPTCLDDTVYGVIAAQGHIILGTQGFRAEKATIEALYTTRFNGVDVNRLSDRYQVPVYTSWRKLVRQFRQSDLSALIPQPSMREQFLRALARGRE